MIRVQYIDVAPANLSPGMIADVIPFDHPNGRLNFAWLRTQPILTVRDSRSPAGPVFETAEIEYRPIEDNETVQDVRCLPLPKPTSVAEVAYI